MPTHYPDFHAPSAPTAPWHTFGPLSLWTHITVKTGLIAPFSTAPCSVAEPQCATNPCAPASQARRQRPSAVGYGLVRPIRIAGQVNRGFHTCGRNIRLQLRQSELPTRGIRAADALRSTSAIEFGADLLASTGNALLQLDESLANRRRDDNSVETRPSPSSPVARLPILD